MLVLTSSRSELTVLKSSSKKAWNLVLKYPTCNLRMRDELEACYLEQIRHAPTLNISTQRGMDLLSCISAIKTQAGQ